MMTGFSAYRNQSPVNSAIPLFERLETNEFMEQQENRKVKEALQKRVTDLEKIIVDLENRLEEQAKINIQVEKECMDIERLWRGKYLTLEQEVEEWKKKFHQQEQKGDRLREHLSRTERELYGLLQRKYQIMRGPGGAGSKLQPVNKQSNEMDNKKEEGQAMPLSYQSSNEEMLVSQHTRSPKEMQQRRVLADLSDFFGM